MGIDQILIRTKIKVKNSRLRNIIWTIQLFFISLLFVACSKGEAYYQFKEIKNGVWDVDNILTFEIDSSIIKANDSYDIFFEVTNNTEYPYQDLWLFSELKINDSISTKFEKRLILADENGTWLGAGFASLYQSSLLISKSFRFKDKGSGVFYIRHGMTDEQLRGIEKVGIKIVLSE